MSKSNAVHEVVRPGGYPPDEGMERMLMSLANNIVHDELVRPEGYPSDEGMEVSTTTSPSSTHDWAFLGTYNDMSLLESGLLQTNIGNMDDNYYTFQDKLGKPIDPRLLSVMEYFRELFVRREEVFKKLFPAGLQDEILELLKKFGNVESQVKSDQMKVRTMQRSLSIDSPRTPFKKGEEVPLKLEYFKVRTVFADGGGQGQQGNQGK
ncbi:POPTR_1452s00200g [Fagus crenata]